MSTLPRLRNIYDGLTDSPKSPTDRPTLKQNIFLPYDDNTIPMIDDAGSPLMANGGVVNPAFEMDNIPTMKLDGVTTKHSNLESDGESKSSRPSIHTRQNNSNEGKLWNGNYDSFQSQQSQNSITNERKAKSGTWDVFRTFAKDKESSLDEARITMILKWVKVVIGTLLSLLVLLTTMLSKSALMLITSNVFYNVTLDCTSINRSHVTSCRRVPPDQPMKTTYRLSQNVEVRWLWALLMVVCFPYVLSLVKCFWRACFKKTVNPSFRVLLAVLLVETLHSTGLSLLAFYLLPSMDPVRGLLLTFGAAFVPSILKTFDISPAKGSRPYITVADTMAVLIQLSILLLWPIRNSLAKENPEEVWVLPLCLVLISLGWWENYVNRTSKLGFLGDKLQELKRKIRRMRTKLYLYASLWKIILSMSLMTILMSDGKSACLRALYFSGNNDVTECPHLEYPVNVINSESPSYFTDPFWVALLQITASFMCYILAKTACKVMLQISSFALPLTLAAPMIAGLFIGACETWEFFRGDVGLMPDYMYWTCDIHGITRGFLDSLMYDYYLPVAFAWWASYIWVTFHIWLPRVERLVQTERLFVQPLYCGVLLEQSLVLNRRRDDYDRDMRRSLKKTLEVTKFLENGELVIPQQPIKHTLDKHETPTPMIYVCATMWHETEREMKNIVTSLLRLDDDQCARHNAREYFDVVDPDYYEFEAHIFFDDAFERHDEEDYEYRLNNFVKQLVSVMDIANSKVHRSQVKIPPPVKTPTPYGGKLEWILPGGNKLFAHLKDKVKIRIKKRWSQVMYMYYLLGYNLVSKPLDAPRKQMIADNTYILALDGDVDFKPSAIKLLVDRMNKNEKLGAACGRIHPIGSGPMVWYQKFEYAVSHWLQKATEHMIGCVLCAPGCFSLFRASAIMDDNVMRRYATRSKEARDFVQYDQGEDRWLSTLLLQQGYRVEYCAAADAQTYCPEGFNEFYNQRRRWSPSTMANIMDLIGDWRHVINVNENISGLFMVYQLLLFVSSLLTPGTIFLLVVGAVNTAFPTINLIEALLINLFPVALFLVVCLFTPTKIQLSLAGVLSAIYALAMMLVVVGLGIQVVQERLCSPTTVFLLFVVGTFVIAAIVHPQELSCIFHGALYFLFVPSMSMLLLIYSVCNLHVVSWGTRETTQPVVPNQQQGEKSTGNSRISSLLSKFSNNSDDESDYGFSFGNLFKCLCCPRPRADSSVEKYKEVLEKLDHIKLTLIGESTTDTTSQTAEDVPRETITMVDVGVLTDSEEKVLEGEQNQRYEADDIVRHNPIYRHTSSPFDENTPFWLNDTAIGNGQIRYLENEEKTFWKDLIKAYLFPLETDGEDQKRLQTDLKELRNIVSLLFLMLNGLFVVIIFALQYTSATSPETSLTVILPCETRTGADLKLQPLSLVFMGIFGIALLIQFISMLFHRLGTFLHIISTTEVNCMKPNQNEIRAFDLASKLQLAKEMQNPLEEDDSRSSSSYNGDVDDSSQSLDDSPRMKRKRTVLHIAKRRRRPPSVEANLDIRFLKSFVEMAEEFKQNERKISESSNMSRGSSRKRSKKANNAIMKLMEDRQTVINKADIAQNKWKTLASKALANKNLTKKNSWRSLMKEALSPNSSALLKIDEGTSSVSSRSSAGNTIAFDRKSSVKFLKQQSNLISDLLEEKQIGESPDRTHEVAKNSNSNDNEQAENGFDTDGGQISIVVEAEINLRSNEDELLNVKNHKILASDSHDVVIDTLDYPNRRLLHLETETKDIASVGENNSDSDLESVETSL